MIFTIALAGRSSALLTTVLPPRGAPAFAAGLLEDTARRLGVSALALEWSVERKAA